MQMNHYRALLAGLMIGTLVLPVSALADDPAPKQVEPAWPGVFITLGPYQAIYEKPVVSPGDKPETYSQKARYIWTGGRYEEIDITLARDLAFKEKYSAKTLKKEEKPPQELEVNKKKAWRWEFPREPGKMNKVVARLVVLLADDKAMILEHKGYGAKLEDVAAKFDFTAVEKALENPPKK